MLTLLQLVSLITLPQKPTAPPKPKPASLQNPVTPTTPTTKADTSMLTLLIAGADANRMLASLEATLDWRYLGKANLSLRPTST